MTRDCVVHSTAMGRTGKYVFAFLLGVALLAWSSVELSSYFLQAQSAHAVKTRAKFRLQPCDVRGSSGALCGAYDVFENRASKSGRKISLNIVVLPALGAHRLA